MNQILRAERGTASAMPASSDHAPGLSGKTARDENFPVASRLVAPALRPHVMAFYDFARAADDVADAPDLGADEKLARLHAMEAGLDGAEGAPVAAGRLCRSLVETGVTNAHARALLSAFRRDATVRRYADWAALLDYCAVSAHPVGRFLLDLHGEDVRRTPTLYAASDALCAALQVLNHLQDLKDDLRRLDRAYMPTDWLAAEGLDVSALAAPAAGPGLRRCIDRALDGCDALLAAAAPLPRRLRSRRLAGESAAILALARGLSKALRRRDPLAERVAPGRRAFAAAGALGLAAALAPRLRRSGRPAEAAA